jgi:hypothetical protein
MIVGIVTVAFGCDNVSWGGMELSLEGPPGDTVPSGDEGSPPGPAPTLRIGQLLYAAIRRGDSAVVVPIGELSDHGLQPFPPGELGVTLGTQILEERLQPGAELTLFHQGVRSGTLVVGAGPGGISTEYCPPRPQALGILELVPGAMGAQQFLALEKPLGREREFGPLHSLTPASTHRVAAQDLAGEALNQAAARWPPALQDIRQDLRVIQLSQEEGPAVMASFLYQDRLAVSQAPDDAYSLLILGEPRGARWERTFTWFRPVAEQGKGAPHFFSQLDWDGDGAHEILLEVFGADARWWAGLDREDGTWRAVFQDSCGTRGAGAESR